MSIFFFFKGPYFDTWGGGNNSKKIAIIVIFISVYSDKPGNANTFVDQASNPLKNISIKEYMIFDREDQC